LTRHLARAAEAAGKQHRFGRCFFAAGGLYTLYTLNFLATAREFLGSCTTNSGSRRRGDLWSPGGRGGTIRTIWRRIRNDGTARATTGRPYATPGRSCSVYTPFFPCIQREVSVGYSVK
jgi:hypothetical protein